MEHGGSVDVTSDWFYEDRVVEVLVAYLRDAGWTIGRVPSATLKEQGVDVTATQGEETLLVEAKGYPSRYYRDESRRHEQKRTDPNNQAQQWFSHALLKALRLQWKHPSARVAMAFPDFPRYQQLFRETAGALAQLSITVYFVEQDGTIQVGDCMVESPSRHEATVARPLPTKANGVQGKYARLADHFEHCADTSVHLSFSEIDTIIGELPASARIHRPWWANHASNPQAVWMRHGFVVSEVSLQTGQVWFARRSV